MTMRTSSPCDGPVQRSSRASAIGRGPLGSAGLLLVLLLAVLSSGCVALVVGGAAAGAAVGTVAYLEGELEATLDASLERSYRATREALEKDLEFAITKQEKNGVSALVVARGVGDRKVTVHLEHETESRTEIRIRVGVFGDEQLSRRIFNLVSRRLRATPREDGGSTEA